jgi:hypothetical protein
MDRLSKMEKEKEKKNNKKPPPHMFSSQVKFQPFSILVVKI